MFLLEMGFVKLQNAIQRQGLATVFANRECRKRHRFEETSCPPFGPVLKIVVALVAARADFLSSYTPVWQGVHRKDPIEAGVLGLITVELVEVFTDGSTGAECTVVLED